MSSLAMVTMIAMAGLHAITLIASLLVRPVAKRHWKKNVAPPMLDSPPNFRDNPPIVHGTP